MEIMAAEARATGQQVEACLDEAASLERAADRVRSVVLRSALQRQAERARRDAEAIQRNQESVLAFRFLVRVLGSDAAPRISLRERSTNADRDRVTVVLNREDAAAMRVLEQQLGLIRARFERVTVAS